MTPTAEILEGFERCQRIPFWSCDWEKRKRRSEWFLEQGIRAAMREKSRDDWGKVAGELIVELAGTNELDTKQLDVYSQIIHLASLADIVSTVLRKPKEPPWNVPKPTDGWNPSPLLFVSPTGNSLRRIVLVSSWSDDRSYSISRAWGSLGAVCHYKMPMQIAVVIIGQQRDGKYRSFWTHGLMHPANKKLRFRKRNDIGVPFKGSWLECWREDRDEISTQEWIQAMLEDDVLRDVCFSLTLDVPPESERQRIVDLAARKLEIVQSTRELPMQNLSTCDWPLSCIFRNPCHAGSKPSPKFGFVRVEDVAQG